VNPRATTCASARASPAIRRPPPPSRCHDACVPAPRDDEAAALVAASAALVEEPELRGWYPTPEAAAPFVARITEIRESPLLVSRAAQEERVREVLGHATGALFPPPVLRRRLEGTAYVFAETGRPEAARRALAIARVLGEPRRTALDVPLVAALVERALGALLAQSTARQEETRSGALVVTPGEFLRDRASSRPARTRA